MNLRASSRWTVVHLTVGVHEPNDSGEKAFPSYFTGALCGADRGRGWKSGWKYVPDDDDTRPVCRVCKSRAQDLLKTVASREEHIERMNPKVGDVRRLTMLGTYKGLGTWRIGPNLINGKDIEKQEVVEDD